MTAPAPLDEVEKLVKEFGAPDENGIPGLKRACERLLAAGNKLERTFSGSWAGYHGRLYYGAFQVPPSDQRFSVEWGTLHGMGGWAEKTQEEVKAEIERLGGKATLDTLEKEIKPLRKRAEELRDDLASYLSVVLEALGLEAERAALAVLAKFKFGRTKEEYVHSNKPGQIVSRDSEAVMQGMRIPSHVYYQGVCHEGITLCEAVPDFLAQVQRLLRQIRLKTARGVALAALKNEDLRDLHSEIFEKCHKLFEDGALAESVEKGFKVVRDRLRELTGHETGSEAFGKGKLHIKGAAASHVDEDFNEGAKFLTMAIDRFRNEKSHTSNAKIDSPTRAHEYLRLSSLAMRLLDDAEIHP